MTCYYYLLINFLNTLCIYPVYHTRFVLLNLIAKYVDFNMSHIYEYKIITYKAWTVSFVMHTVSTCIDLVCQFYSWFSELKHVSKDEKHWFKIKLVNLGNHYFIPPEVLISALLRKYRKSLSHILKKSNTTIVVPLCFRTFQEITNRIEVVVCFCSMSVLITQSSRH